MVSKTRSISNHFYTSSTIVLCFGLLVYELRILVLVLDDLAVAVFPRDTAVQTDNAKCQAE